MTTREKQNIIYCYVCASIDKKIPSRPGFVPGLGKTIDVSAHAFDIARIIIRTHRENSFLVNIEAFKQLQSILSYCKITSP